MMYPENYPRHGLDGRYMNLRRRSASGSMMAMMVSAVIVMAAVILFGLWYTQHTLTTTEHRSSVESAALAASNAISRIVIQTPEFGYVSLSGNAPTGTTTKAPDNWFQRVHSLNELMATARMQLLIADQIDDPMLRALAIKDRDDVVKAKDALIAEINKALVKGGFALDVDGNQVRAYDEALGLYLSNPSLASSYVPDSMELKLGSVTGGVPTAIGIPKAANPGVPGSDQINGKYRSDTNIPWKGVDFVFASVTDQPALVEYKKFTENVSGLPFQMPGAVHVFARHKFSNQGRENIVPYSAVATAGGVFRASAPGTFMISFPDGPMTEIGRLRDLYEWKEMKDLDIDYLTAEKGDYPTEISSGAVMSPHPNPPPWTSKPTAAAMTLLCLHDWVRQVGSRLDVDDFISTLNKPLNAPNPAMTFWRSRDADLLPIDIGLVPTGIKHLFKVGPDGKIIYSSKTMQPAPYFDVAMNQAYAEGFGIDSKTPVFPQVTVLFGDAKKGKVPEPRVIKALKDWDVYFRDNVRQLGAPSGGKHVGEPMETNQVSRSEVPCDLAWTSDYGGGGSGAKPKPGNGQGLPPIVSDLTDFALTTTTPPPVYESYKPGPASGAPRPTYTKDGLDVEIRFRRQLDVASLDLLFGKKGYKGLME
jgi:hypothetical protein